MQYSRYLERKTSRIGRARGGRTDLPLRPCRDAFHAGSLDWTRAYGGNLTRSCKACPNVHGCPVALSYVGYGHWTVSEATGSAVKTVARWVLSPAGVKAAKEIRARFVRSTYMDRPATTSSRLEPPCKERETAGSTTPWSSNLASLVRYVCFLSVPVDEGYQILERSCRESISRPRLWKCGCLCLPTLVFRASDHQPLGGRIRVGGSSL